MADYYDMKHVTAMIAEVLLNRQDTWKVYGYKPDNSDAMYDYFDPAHWNGVATKNGFVLVVNNRSASTSGAPIRTSTGRGRNTVEQNEKLQKIKNLADRPGTEGEGLAAQAAYESLKKKLTEMNAESWVVTGAYPTYQPNPNRAMWHIEKDGKILAKGAGIAKFRSLMFFYNHITDSVEIPSRVEHYDSKTGTRETIFRSAEPERATRVYLEDNAEKVALVEEFRVFIRKLDSLCGGQLSSEGVYTKLVKDVQYDTKLSCVPQESSSFKSIRVGDYFVETLYRETLGDVYVITKDMGTMIKAVRMNSSLTAPRKETSSNTRYINTSTFRSAVGTGRIKIVTLEEVNAPKETFKTIEVTKEQASTRVSNRQLWAISELWGITPDKEKLSRIRANTLISMAIQGRNMTAEVEKLQAQV